MILVMGKYSIYIVYEYINLFLYVSKLLVTWSHQLSNVEWIEQKIYEFSIFLFVMVVLF